MTIFNKNKLALVAAIALMNGAAMNGAFANEITETSVKAVQQSQGTLIEIGTPVASEPLKGFAHNLPLIEVLRQVTPNGWMVKKNEKSGKPLNVKKLISWEGGHTWVETLNKIAVVNDLFVSINWNKKEITVADVSPAVTTTTVVSTVKSTSVERKSLFELEPDNTSNLIKGNSGQKTVVDTKVVGLQRPMVTTVVTPVVAVVPVVAPRLETWQIKAGSSLKQNVMEMAKKAGYKVVWTGEDYPADDDRTLAGRFDAENGPIMQLSIDYGPKSRVEQPLSFVFFQNNTLVVENYKFEQSGTPQYIH